MIMITLRNEFNTFSTREKEREKRQHRAMRSLCVLLFHERKEFHLAFSGLSQCTRLFTFAFNTTKRTHQVKALLNLHVHAPMCTMNEEKDSVRRHLFTLMKKQSPYNSIKTKRMKDRRRFSQGKVIRSNRPQIDSLSRHKVYALRILRPSDHADGESLSTIWKQVRLMIDGLSKSQIEVHYPDDRSMTSSTSTNLDFIVHC